LKRVPYHEYQHSIFDKNLAYVKGDMTCAAGHYTVPTGVGHGVEPADSVFRHVLKG
jgi:galactonate dehydratase